MIAKILCILLALTQLGLAIFYYPQLSATLGYHAEATPVPPDDGSLHLFTPAVKVQPNIQVTTNQVIRQLCSELGDFSSDDNAQAVRRWLEARGVVGRVDTRVAITESSYRVYVGDFASEDEAVFAQQVVQMRNPSYKNALIYQSDKVWRVSFGQFSDKLLMEDFKQNLAASVDGLKVFVDARQQTSTVKRLRFVENAAERLKLLTRDAGLLVLLEQHGVSLRRCN